MAEVVQSTQQEFWRPPPVGESIAPVVESFPLVATACARCGAEFMIGALFCHACGIRRTEKKPAGESASTAVGLLEQSLAWLQTVTEAFSQNSGYLPRWLRYLHFHEIKRWVGLPTAAFVAFMIGLGCVAGAIGVGVFYKASNLSEFQAVQLWRIEWLLAATASFAAGILLRRPSDQ